LFYDRFISLVNFSNNLYIHLKWIIVFHQIIQNFKNRNPLFGYTLKALQVYIEDYSIFEQKLEFQPY
jgi:hypothetical protein